MLCWLLLATLVNAQPQELSLSGFGTLGVVSSDSKQYGYRTDLAKNKGSFNDTPHYANSVLGLQLDYPLHANTDLIFQSVYNNQDTLSLDTTTKLAFVRHTANPNWSLRAGRTALDLFLLTEYRDVGFGYVWAHTPSEVYGLVPYRYLDGIDVTHSLKINRLNLRSKLFTGTSSADFTSYENSESVKLNNLIGLSFNLESSHWSLQYRYTSAHVANELQSTERIISGLKALEKSVPSFDSIWPNSDATITSLRLKGRNGSYMSLGGKYDWQRWSALAELARVRPTSSFNTVTSGYASMIYYSQRFSLYGIYSATHSHIFDINTLGIDLITLSSIPAGAEIYAGVDANLNIYSTSQSTWSLGGRWNLSPSLALKCQWDRTHIHSQGDVLWLNKHAASAPQETVNTLFFSLSFIF